MNITIDDFAKVEARVGKVVSAECVEGSDKLILCMIDFGEESPRQILSGIQKWYPDPTVLVGKMLLYCTNLEPRKMMGQESNGMLMAVDGLDGQPVFLVPDQEVNPGAKIH
jgi:methionyl-tRNA synthetase